MDFQIRDGLHALQMPYLWAIQKIPGDTAGEKWCWIGRLSLHEANEELEQFPPELLPILRVETAIKKKRYEDITSALKCEDSTIINRAFKASWFFDGSHKKIVDVTYFCQRLFPYVSVNTRTRIVSTLAYRLSGKDPIFAQEMFTAVSSIYNIQTAYPLFIACDEDFGYKMIVDKKLILPVRIVKKIYRKNPDLIVRFLKLLKPLYDLNETKRNPFVIGIDRYKAFLPKLIKKRLEAFVELYETHFKTLNIVLSNTCAEIFLKKAQQHVIKNPRLYIRILPLKKINEDLMETIFPDLLPAESCNFNTDGALDYLLYYPYNKKYDLLHKSYKNKYHADILDKTVNVTPQLMKFLSVEERNKQARIKMGKQEIYCEYTTDYEERTWICYLPVNEAIPVIKKTINKTSDETNRLSLICQMIYVCKINEDEEALANTLTYLLNRHKNEKYSLFERMFNTLLKIYDVSDLNEKHISLIWDIVQLFYVKNGVRSSRIIKTIIHFKLMNNMPIEELINMLLEERYGYIHFNMLKKYPQYERRCLVTFANEIQKKSFKNFDEKTDYFGNFVLAIYDFNNEINYEDSLTMEKMTIKDYPWLMDFTLETIRREVTFWEQKLKDVLRENESELYQNWFPEDIVTLNVITGKALALLNRNSQNILDDWEKYLVYCMENSHLKCVQHFVKTVRWYKDLPIKFAHHCLNYIHNYIIYNYIHDNDIGKISSSILILIILLHGNVVTKLIEPLIPTETTVDINPNVKYRYKIIRNLSRSMRFSNPPVSLDLIIRLCPGDYLSIALMALTNISRRTSVPKVKSAVEKLMNMRVSTRKHGIRLMYLVASAYEFTDFLQQTWTIESHHSLRLVLFKALHKFFLIKPSSETWSLYCQVMSTLNLEDKDLFLKMELFPEISNEYVMKYLELWLKTIDNFRGMGLDIKTIKEHISCYLKTFEASIFNLLSEEFVENILRRFLFQIDFEYSEYCTVLSTEMRRFTISYILSKVEDKQYACIKVFANVFHNAVTTYWNVKKSGYYPINQQVDLFIDKFITSYIKKFCPNKSINPEIIDSMQTIFLSALSPTQHVESYLLLVYAKKLQECSLTKTSFGLRLGQQLNELIDIFSSLLVSFMAVVLREFLKSIHTYFDLDLEEVKLSVMEGLIEAGNVNSRFMAVSLLPFRYERSIQFATRYEQLLEQFRKMEEPIVTILNYRYY